MLLIDTIQKLSLKDKERYQQNKETLKAKSKAYYQKNKDKINEKRKIKKRIEEAENGAHFD